MTVSAAPRKAGPYVGTGATNTFAFAFKTTSPDLLRVVEADALGAETDLAYGAGYTVALNGNQDTSPGGTITRVAGNLPVDYRLTILSNVPYSQQTDIPSGGVLSEVTVENALDVLAIQVQQLAERTSRAVEVPPTSGLSVPALLEQIVTSGETAALANATANDALATAAQANATASQAVALAASLNLSTAAAPNTTMQRDAAGRSQVASPSAAADIATKEYVDSADTNHANLTSSAHGANTTPVGDTLMARNAAGQSQVASPSVAADIANKGYVDGSKSMAANGWVELPGGLILQWGTVSVSGNSNVVVNLPRSFPTAGIWGVAGYNGNTEISYTASVMALTTSQITVRSAGANGKTLNWFALGY